MPPSSPMSSRRRAATAFFLAASLLAAGTASAADPAPAPLGRLALSARLAEWGRADKNPLALIVAAQIRQGVGAKAIDRTPEQTGEATPAPAAANEASVEALLAEAVALAGKDATVAALADDVRGNASKGLVQGAGVSRATLRPAGTDWYRRLGFEGTRYAEAYVETAGQGNVQISVWDEAGNLVCRDPNPSAVAYCGWVPSSTAKFDVKVENRSAVAVPYRMFTN